MHFVVADGVAAVEHGLMVGEHAPWDVFVGACGLGNWFSAIFCFFEGVAVDEIRFFFGVWVQGGECVRGGEFVSGV